MLTAQIGSSAGCADFSCATERLHGMLFMWMLNKCICAIKPVYSCCYLLTPPQRLWECKPCIDTCLWWRHAQVPCLRLHVPATVSCCVSLQRRCSGGLLAEEPQVWKHTYCSIHCPKSESLTHHWCEKCLRDDHWCDHLTLFARCNKKGQDSDELMMINYFVGNSKILKSVTDKRRS